jgi:hypothetical protein
VGVALLLLLGPNDDRINEILGRLARGKVTVDHVRGCLVGLIGGILVGAAVLAIAGRSLAAVVVACLLMIGGAVFGAVRQAGESELPMFLLLAAATAGVAVGAALGGLLGAVVGLARE